MREDIIERLKHLLVWLPEKTTIGDGPAWGKSILTDAITEIQILRAYHDRNELMLAHAGAVTCGESFDDIKRRVGRQSKVREAAPDMLAALKLLMGMYNDQAQEEISHGVAPVEPLWVGTVRDAIAKSESR